jgi:hypothetical protein
MASPEWFDRLDAAFGAGRLEEHALALRAEGAPLQRVALSLLVFFPRELRVRGRGAEVPRLLEAAPRVLDALGVPVARLEESLRERALGRLVFALHDDEGWVKGRIIAALMCFSTLLDATGRDDEAVLAQLDRLTGFAPRERHLWPEEPEAG